MSNTAFEVAVLQMNSGEDKARNVETALRLIDDAAATGARLVVLPEIWTYLGNEEGNRANAERIPGPITDALAAKAKQHGIYLHGGTMLEKRDGEPKLFTPPSSSTRAVSWSRNTARSICSMWCWTASHRTRNRTRSNAGKRS